MGLGVRLASRHRSVTITRVPQNAKVHSLKLIFQIILKSINITKILHHLLSNFKIGKPNKIEMFHCYSLAV